MVDYHDEFEAIFETVIDEAHWVQAGLFWRRKSEVQIS
jgi:hypothetical protein